MDKRCKIINLKDYIEYKKLKSFEDFREKITKRRCEIFSKEIDNLLIDLHSINEKEEDK